MILILPTAGIHKLLRSSLMGINFAYDLRIICAHYFILYHSAFDSGQNLRSSSAGRQIGIRCPSGSVDTGLVGTGDGNSIPTAQDG